MCRNFCFASLLGIPIEITSSAIGLKICTITAWFKKHKSIIKKKKQKMIKCIAKAKLNTKKVLFSKTLINSWISYDESILSNKMIKNTMIRKKKSEI